MTRASTARLDLERELSTRLKVLDDLETEADAPGRAEALAPELAHADMALTATVRALRALAPPVAATRAGTSPGRA